MGPTDRIETAFAKRGRTQNMLSFLESKLKSDVGLLSESRRYENFECGIVLKIVEQKGTKSVEKVIRASCR